MHHRTSRPSLRQAPSMSTRAQPVGMSCRATQSRQSTRPFGFRAFVPRLAWTSMIACVCARLRFLLEQRPAGLRAPYTWARAQCYAMLPFGMILAETGNRYTHVQSHVSHMNHDRLSIERPKLQMLCDLEHLVSCCGCVLRQCRHCSDTCGAVCVHHNRSTIH